MPGFTLADLAAIELVVYETVGPESWLDNVHISEQVSAVPELSSKYSLAAGLLIMVISFARKRKEFSARVRDKFGKTDWCGEVARTKRSSASAWMIDRPATR